jgi:hypothetical protein
MAVAIAIAGRVASYFIVPAEPPSLVRLRNILEPLVEEQRMYEETASRLYPPPPEVVLLRAIAEIGGSSGNEYRALEI